MAQFRRLIADGRVLRVIRETSERDEVRTVESNAGGELDNRTITDVRERRLLHIILVIISRHMDKYLSADKRTKKQEKRGKEEREKKNGGLSVPARV